MHKLLAVAATLFSIFMAFTAPTAASRILVLLHKRRSPCRPSQKPPNVVVQGIPGVHGIASDGKFLAVAITDVTGDSRRPQIVLLDIRQSAPLATIRLPGAGGHVAVFTLTG